MLRHLLSPWLAPLMRQRLLCRLMLAAVLLLGAGSLKGWHLWSCPFAELTGLPCPGCGMTRAFLAMARGDWSSALRLHPFAPFFALVGLICSVVSLLPEGLARRISDQTERLERKTKLPAIVLIIFAFFGLLRMLGIWYQPPMPEPMKPYKRVLTAVGSYKQSILKQTQILWNPTIKQPPSQAQPPAAS